jgi:hypothetical protein
MLDPACGALLRCCWLLAGCARCAAMLLPLLLLLLPPAAGVDAVAATGWMLWPRDVNQFLVRPNASAVLTWNVSAPGVVSADSTTFDYFMGTYTGCTPKCVKGGPNFSCPIKDRCAGWGLPGARDGRNSGGSVQWPGGGQPLSLEVTLPTTGYYTITWIMPSKDGRNATFGVVAMPDLPAAAQPDPVFSVCSFLSLAAYGPGWTPYNGGFVQPDSPPWGDKRGPRAFASYRPEFTQWRRQIVGLLSRLGVASVREWGVGSDGGVFSPNGSLAFNPVAMQIRQELAAAKIGIVDLELSPEPWMGLGWGSKQLARNLSAYAWKWEVQSKMWGGSSGAGVQRDYIELYNELVRGMRDVARLAYISVVASYDIPPRPAHRCAPLDRW